jgi:TRAP-type C4-dicarboxylate transport system substrate-binding protein
MTYSVKKLAAHVALGLLAVSSAAAYAQNINLKVIGQPIATGKIQKNIEQPFFENLAAQTGLPITVEYKPLDTLGIKDTEQLRIMKAGLFDLVSLRFSQNSRDEPTLLGLDLVGVAPDYATSRKVADAWQPTLDARLQKQFNVKLLGHWPFGPQILFCKPDITKLTDVKGLKVRVADQNLAKFFQLLGATPVSMSFGEVHQALSLGVVDCAVTGPSSANSASWPEIVSNQLPLGFQMGFNGYGISTKVWDKMTPEQQAKLQAAFTKLQNDTWAYSEELYSDALACNAGEASCKAGKKFKLKTVAVSAEDKALVGTAVEKVSLPAWAPVCDSSNPTCSADWKKTVGQVVNVK